MVGLGQELKNEVPEVFVEGTLVLYHESKP